MDTKTMIWTLKERLKTMAAQQKPLKRARKTSIPKEERGALLLDAGIEHCWAVICDRTGASNAAAFVRERRARITACLNLYNELRGREYRHGIKKGFEYLYDKEMKKLTEELAKV